MGQWAQNEYSHYGWAFPSQNRKDSSPTRMSGQPAPRKDKYGLSFRQGLRNFAGCRLLVFRTTRSSAEGWFLCLPRNEHGWFAFQKRNPPKMTGAYTPKGALASRSPALDSPVNLRCLLLPQAPAHRSRPQTQAGACRSMLERACQF